jgi:hypothetical protein
MFVRREFRYMTLAGLWVFFRFERGLSEDEAERRVEIIISCADAVWSGSPATWRYKALITKWNTSTYTDALASQFMTTPGSNTSHILNYLGGCRLTRYRGQGIGITISSVGMIPPRSWSLKRFTRKEVDGCTSGLCRESTGGRHDR